MAIITKIEEQKNKKRVNIFVDDAFFCGISKETALVFRFKVGSVVDENVLQDAIFESEVKRAFEKASDYLSVRMHTKKELFEKLLKKGYQTEVISKAIEKLEEYHFVDDGMMAKEYILQNSKYSKRMLENKLRAKGVSNEIVKDTISERSEEEEFLLCKCHAEKYVNSRDMQKEGAVQKMVASLLRKGFSYDNVKKCVNLIFHDEDVENMFFD